MAAAVPAAWPVAKQGGITRIAPFAWWSAEMQRPGDQKVHDAVGDQAAVGDVEEAPALDEEPLMTLLAFSGGIVDVHEEGVPGDGVVEAAGMLDVVSGEGVQAGDPAGFADADLRPGVDQIGLLQPWAVLVEEAQQIAGLTPPFDLGAGQAVGVGTVDIEDARRVDPPLPGRGCR